MFVVGFLREKPVSEGDLFEEIKGGSGALIHSQCGCLLLGEAWVREHVRCLHQNCAMDNQGVPRTEMYQGRFLTCFFPWKYPHKCSFC